MSFTFKRHVPTGPYRSFSRIYTDIKIKEEQVGVINEGAGFDNWRITLFVKDEKNEACGWRHAKLKKIFASEQEVRDWLKNNYELLNEKFEIVGI